MTIVTNCPSSVATRRRTRTRPGRRIRPNRNGRDGFTLVETMVAVFLLTIGLLGVSQVFTVSSRHTMNSRKETVANSLAQEIREKIMSETFADVHSIFDGIDTNSGTIAGPAQDWADHVIDRLGIGARGQVDIQLPAERADLEDGMLAVVITLSWYEGETLIDLPFEFAIAKIGA